MFGRTKTDIKNYYIMRENMRIDIVIEKKKCV